MHRVLGIGSLCRPTCSEHSRGCAPGGILVLAHSLSHLHQQQLGHQGHHCSQHYSGHCSRGGYAPPIPYGEQTEDDALFFEDGFKRVRGYLTEGHYLVIESNGHALTNEGVEKQFTATEASDRHDDIHQRWVLHALEEEGTTFHITSALDGKYISQHSSLSNSESGAQVYNITYAGEGEYHFQKENGKYLNIDEEGKLSFDHDPIGYKLFSVTYHED